MTEFQVGDYVTAFYKSGKYIGEITDIRPQHYLVKVLAVQKHPMQGDIHHPKDTDVGIFHERRALAYREQTNVPIKMVKPFDGDIPDYKASLRIAVSEIKKELSEASSPWADKCLELVHSLEKDYFK